ncbi:MAG: hypothetical protein O3B08_14765 [Proteobacteria bacterium]|nr:hypothetical protein [Pseudomonadota bacterium]
MYTILRCLLSAICTMFGVDDTTRRRERPPPSVIGPESFGR